MIRVVMDLEVVDEKALVRLLREMLKRLLRDHGIKCRSVTTTP